MGENTVVVATFTAQLEAAVYTPALRLASQDGPVAAFDKLLFAFASVRH